MAPEVRNRGERIGHWGLGGMRERAERLGGKLEVWSEPGAGTEVDLRVPASIAYQSSPVRNISGYFGKRRRTIMKTTLNPIRILLADDHSYVASRHTGPCG